MIGRRIQNYKVISLLGQGGMGAVYKCFDIKLERYAALKILNLNTAHNSNFVERFKREARNQAKLSHPNIVSVYGFVEEKDILGIAIEYIEGDTLESLIRDNGRIEFTYSLELISQILSGIEFAHQQGFIHRDLKPSNIILDLNGNPKIMDFGISKSIDELKSITQHNARPGTLLYMSPEQLGGNLITFKSDLYALGITFYEMLTGVHPYNAQTIYEIIDSHVNKIPVKVSSQIPSIPIVVDEIILRAMDKSIGDNFLSTTEFKNAILGLRVNYSYQKNNDESFSFSEVDAPTDIIKKKSKGFQTVSNILLFIIFIGLVVIVFNVVKSIIVEESEKTQSEMLSYSQDYSNNPNFAKESMWELIKTGTNKNLNSISFVDDYKGFIAGDSGLIMQSVDGGLNWKTFNTPYSNSFNAICFNDNKLFVVGSSGFVGIINSNSNQIKKIISNTTEALFKIYFLDHNIGFIVGSHGQILKTYDGGMTWQVINSSVKENLFSISFADSKNGIIVGWNGTILKTTDSGLSWQKQALKYNNYFKDVLFANEFLGFIVGGDGIVLRTENGGENWDEIDIESNSGLYKLNFENSGDGIILSNRGEIFTSNDAGKSWIKKNVGQPLILNDIKQLNSGNFIIACNGGNIYKSKISSSK
ncbi:MAG: protein kinase [Ignavibacteriaceae bacterium]|nr:protein kinase [Ignavibacterium sp.]MCC6255727.1 protein kinase [Ignavibacteriaceae bacterium]HRN27718.1 protein kinase [Ignavibacteriaceae bacterium]HRP92278.1 protein kinase [Ignavibacteriaceae bacterium]HRQ53761.1 protein kinase [Ignavibacteriaceae bacterium]